MAKRSYSRSKAIKGMALAAGQLRLGPVDTSIQVARLHAATFIIGHFAGAGPKKPAVYDAAIAYITKHLKITE